MSQEETIVAKKSKKINESIPTKSEIIAPTPSTPTPTKNLKMLTQEFMEEIGWKSLDEIEPEVIKKKASEFRASVNLFQKKIEQIYKEHEEAKKIDDFLDCGDWGAPATPTKTRPTPSTTATNSSPVKVPTETLKSPDQVMTSPKVQSATMTSQKDGDVLESIFSLMQNTKHLTPVTPVRSNRPTKSDSNIPNKENGNITLPNKDQLTKPEVTSEDPEKNLQTFRSSLILSDESDSESENEPEVTKLKENKPEVKNLATKSKTVLESRIAL